MAKYLVLIWGDKDAWAQADATERARIGAGHQRFREIAADAVLAGEELVPAEYATSLRGPRTGRRPDLTDGPFLETKEVVGGYYVLDVPDLDRAVELAALLPETDASYPSGVEIRPVVGAV